MPTTLMHRIDTVMTGPPGAPFYSRSYYDLAGATAEVHAASVRSFWDGIKGVIAAGTSILVQPVVYTVDPVSGDIVGSTAIAPPSAVGGTASDEAMPFANQGVLNLRTGVFLGGRELRGRLFIPSMTQAANASGITAPAYRTSINASAVGLTAGGGCVYSPTHGRWEYVATRDTATKIGVLRSRRD